MRAIRDADLIIAELQKARSEVLEAIAGLGEEQMSKPAADGWSIKDHLTHLMAVDELRFFEISRIARGGSAAFLEVSDEQFDQLNAVMSEPRRVMPVKQVLKDMEFARALVLEAITQSPEGALDENRFGEIGLRGSAGHDLSHAAIIRRIREKEGI